MKLIKNKNKYGYDYLILTPREYIEHTLHEYGESILDITNTWLGVDSSELDIDYECYQIYGDNMDMPSVGIEKNLSALLDDVSDCIFVCDLETYEIYYANETACRWIKASSDNIVGKKCYEIIGGYDSPCPCCINSSILNDHGYHTFEFFSNDTNIEFPSKCKISKWNGCPSRVQIIQNLDNP